MNLGNINTRQQRLAIFAIVAVAFLAGDRLVITPLTTSWKARAARITQLKRDVEHGASLLNQERAIRTTWDRLRTNTLSGELSTAQSQVIKAFNRWSQESGVSIGSIRPQWKQNADDYMTLECRADATGSLAALSRFLFQAETDPMALKIEAMELTVRDAEGQQLTLGLQVSGLLLKLPGS